MFRLIAYALVFGLNCLLAWLFSSENRPFEKMLLYVVTGQLTTLVVDFRLMTSYLAGKKTNETDLPKG